MLEIRLLEARGEADRATAHDIFGPDFLIRRPLLQALDAHDGGPGPADRRDRPGGRGVRGVPARDPVRLPGDRARDRHDPGRAHAAGDPDLQPDPRGPRRPEAALPLPLDRLPELRARARDRAHPRAGGARTAGPPDRRLRPSAARGRPDQGPRRRRDARLGVGAARPGCRRARPGGRRRHPRAWSSSTRRTSAASAARRPARCSRSSPPAPSRGETADGSDGARARARSGWGARPGSCPWRLRAWPAARPSTAGASWAGPSDSRGSSGWPGWPPTSARRSTSAGRSA